MYHSRKLPVLIQSPHRLSKSTNGKLVEEAKHARLYIAVQDKPAHHTRLDKPLLTIGRSRRNDIVLSEEGIDPFHARLKQTPAGWEVEDLGSQSGTRLNGSPLQPNTPKSWDSRQPLKIAGYTLHWLQPPNSPSAAASAPLLGSSAAAALPPASKDGLLSDVLSRPWPYFSLSLILIWLLVLFGLPYALPLLLGSVLTFIGVFITPGYLLAEMITWRLGLDKIELLALAFPLGIVVLAVPGMTALLLHLTLTELAVGWAIASAVVLVLWILGHLSLPLVGRLFTDLSREERPSKPWAKDELILLFCLISLFIIIFPALSLYKIDGDAYAVNTFAVDTLAGLPLNAREPLFGTDLGTGVRMVFNQYLPLSYLWSYFSGLNTIDLMSSFSRQILALWSVLATYMLGKEAGKGSRRFGLFTAAIQLLIFAAAPFWHGDNVAIYFFERINADKFLVMTLLVPPCIALAIRYVQNGRWAAWIGAALVALAVSTIHPLSAAMLALALAAFGGTHFLFNLRQRAAWKRVIGVAALAAVVMLLPIIQLFLSRGDEPLAASYPASFEDWPMVEEQTPLLPYVTVTALDLYGPLPQLDQLDARAAGSTTNPFLIWRFAVNMGRQRLIVFDDDHFIAHPRLLLEPPYLLALLLLPLLLLRIRQNPAVQFAVGTTAAILMVMFNPLVTPLIGSLVMPWILWRFVWLLPYALIIALGVQQILVPKLNAIANQNESEADDGPWFSLAILGRFKHTNRAYLLTIFVIIFALLALPSIRRHSLQLKYDSSSSYFYPKPQRIFDHLNSRLRANSPAMVLADQDLSVTVAAYVAHAGILAHRVPTTSEIFPADQQDIALQRLIDQDTFFRTAYLTAESIAILNRYNIQYIIAPSGGSLDLQLQLAPDWFAWQLDDQSYSLYAVNLNRLPAADNPVIQGNDALAERAWATARGFYETVLDQNPDDLLALAGLATIAQQQGQFDGAVSLWRRAVETADLPILHARLGQIYGLQADLEQSAAEWDQAATLAPNVAAYLIGLGDACLLNGLEDCAAEAYAAAAVKRSLPDQVARLLVEANLWQQQGRFDRAVPLYEQVVERQPTRFNEYILESVYREAGHPEQAEALLQRLRAADPFSSELMRVEANMLTTVNRAGEAIDLYYQALNLERLEVEDTVETRLALAQLLLDAGLLDEAGQEINTILTLSPNNGEASRLLGDLYQRQGSFDQATRLYEDAFRYEPTRVTTYIAYNNQLRRHNGRPEDWFTVLQSAVRYNPDEPSLYLALGDYWQQQGNRPAAISAYLSALERLDPAAQTGQFLPPASREGRSFVYSHLARIYEDQGQITAALNYYQAMVSLAPGSPWTKVAMGDAWLRQDNLEAAETLYSQALDIDPDYIIAYLRLSELNEARGDFEEAAVLQEEALRLAQEQLARPLAEPLSVGNQTAVLELPTFSDSESPSAASATAGSNALLQQIQLAEEQLSTLGLLTHLYVLTGQTEQAVELYQNRLNQIEDFEGATTLEAQYQKGLGDLYLSQGQAQLAREAYQRALDLDQWWSEARLGLANAYLAQFDIDSAIAELETAVEIAPGVIDVQLALADAFLQQGRPNEARQIYERMVTTYPNNARAKESLAEYYAAYSQPFAAIELYQEALERDPDNADPYLALSQLYSAQGQADQAQAVLESGLNVMADATDLTTALSNLYITQNKPEEALALLGQGLSRIGENTPLLVAMGSYNASRANYDQATDLYQQALQADPDSAAVRVAMADLAQHLGNIDQALELYEEAVSLAPTSTGYWLALAAAYQANDQDEQALDAYAEALAVEPDLTAAYIARAAIFQRQERWVEAEATYDVGLGIIHNSARLLSAYAGFLLDRGEGSRTRALDLLALAKESAYDVPTLVAIAALYDEVGQPEVSEELLARALELEPGSLVALIGLGDFYEEQGRTGEAQQIYEQVIALNPGLPLGYLRLGNLANVAGDQETADEYAALAQQVAPGYFGP